MKRLKAILGLLLIFFLGAVSGGFVVHHAHRFGIEAALSGKGGETGDLIVRRLTRSLDLDKSQQEQVRAIVASTHGEIEQIRKPVQPLIDAAIDRSRQRVRQILRPDQQEKFDRIQAERRARRERER